MLFAVAVRAGLALVGRAALFAAAGRVAGTFTGAFLAATTPAPLNAPGLAVAAIGGFPWFSEANRERSWLAACSCCVCALVAAMCRSLAAASCCAVGRAVIPPVPPL